MRFTLRRTAICASSALALLVAAATVLVAAHAADPLPPGSWTLHWQDEFSGTSLDTSKWTTWTSAYADECRGNHGDHKLEYNLPQNLVVGNGVLTITAKKQNYTSPSGTPYTWTSGLITTGDSCGHDPAGGVTVRKGDYIQIEAKLPGQMGMWPAFWTWQGPTNEVDVFEYHPDNPTLLELSNHTPGGGDFNYDAGYNLSAGWHYFGAYLGSSTVDYYLDGELIYRDPHPFNSAGAKLIIDLAVSDGTYHAAPTGTSAQMLVGSAKVFRKA